MSLLSDNNIDDALRGLDNKSVIKYRAWAELRGYESQDKVSLILVLPADDSGFSSCITYRLEATWQESANIFLEIIKRDQNRNSTQQPST